MSYTKFESTPSPYYKGKGEHSVLALEKLCEDFKELLYQKQIRLQETEALLEEKTQMLVDMPETGWGAEHESWRYRHIHPEVEKMGGWANYRFYMLKGRYRDAREFNDIKSKLSTAMTALERLWKYSIKKRDRDMEIIVVDALESNGFNFNAERKV